MTDLREIPGVGPAMEARLLRLGFDSVASLKGQDPEMMYQADRAINGGTLDRCVLYVYRLAVYYADNDVRDPEKLKWWRWKDSADGRASSGCQ